MGFGFGNRTRGSHMIVGKMIRHIEVKMMLVCGALLACPRVPARNLIDPSSGRRSPDQKDVLQLRACRRCWYSDEEQQGELRRGRAAGTLVLNYSTTD